MIEEIIVIHPNLNKNNVVQEIDFFVKRGGSACIYCKSAQIKELLPIIWEYNKICKNKYKIENSYNRSNNGFFIDIKTSKSRLIITNIQKLFEEIQNPKSKYYSLLQDIPKKSLDF